MPNFSQINSLARADILLRQATPNDVLVNAAYVRGDHFRLGEEWIGPPVPPEYKDGLAQLERTWVPIPVVNECLEGHTAGILGREPMFENVRREALPEDASQEDKDAANTATEAINSAFGVWCDTRNLSAILQEWAGRLRWAGRAPLRLFVPPGLLEKQVDGFWRLPKEVTTPQQALQYIFLHPPNVERAMVYVDPRSFSECGLFRYDEGPEFLDDVTSLDTKRRLEKVFVADADAPPAAPGRPRIERDKTVLQTLEVGIVGPTIGEDAVVQEVVFPCGGFSLMFEAKLPLLLTDPARRMQRAINLLSTILAINATYAGFRSRDYFNVTDTKDTGNPDGDVTASATSVLMWYAQPYKVKNKEGQEETKYLEPRLVTTEPIDGKPLIELTLAWERQLRRWFRQEHTLFTGVTDVSAVALVQMRSAFLLSLLQTKPAVEDALNWLQGAAWCFALYLCGQSDEIPSFVETYRQSATAKPYTGPLTPDEMRVIVEMVGARLMSREFAAMMLGVEDVDAEIQRIKIEDETSLDAQLKRAQILSELSNVFDVATAARGAGYDETWMEKMNITAANLEAVA